jgi:hypothetical protein
VVLDLEWLKNSGRVLKAGWKIPRGFGVRQPSAALRLQSLRVKSGGGPPQSRTLTRRSLTQTILVVTEFLNCPGVMSVLCAD